MLRSVRSCWSARGFALLALVVGYDLLAKPIRLRSGTLDPEAGPRGSAVIPENRAGLYLVQFRGPLDGAARSALRNVGIELLRSVPEDTYVVRLEPREVGLVQTLPFVEWVGEYAAEHKVHARLHGYIQRNRGGELASVSILVRPKATAAETRETEGAFQSLKQKSLATFGTILRGKVSGARLANLAKSSAVLWIEPGPEFKLVDEVASKIVAGDGGVNVTMAQAAGFDGRGVTVAVADSGLHNGDAATMHPDLF